MKRGLPPAVSASFESTSVFSRPSRSSASSAASVGLKGATGNAV